MKENDGKAGQKLAIQNILILISFSITLMFTLHYVSTQKGSTIDDYNNQYPSTDNARQYNAQLQYSRKNRHDRMNRQGFNDNNQRRRSRYYDLLPDSARGMTDEELILSATVHLIDIVVPHHSFSSSSNNVIQGVFCRVNWEHHKANPNEVPMFRFLVQKSAHCNDHNPIIMDLDEEFIQKIKLYDEDYGITAMRPTGFVFHESRCGSTLVANSLAVFNPQLTRVYSESQPPSRILSSCDDNDEESCISYLRNIMYLMGRTSSEMEKYLFFKINSMSTLKMHYILKAFPDTPWVFVYRDPVEVMASQLRVSDINRANCVKHRHSPPDLVRKIVKKGFERKMRSLSAEEYCAAHLSSLCQSALTNFEQAHNGLLVNYNKFPNAIFEYIIPIHFQIPLESKQIKNIQDISQYYSKQKDHSKPVYFTGDNEKKQQKASTAIIEASQLFLSPFYTGLEAKSIIK